MMLIYLPMTIFNKKYFQYILDGFKKLDELVYHFCLMAEENTIYERLRGRGELEGNWCFQQVSTCSEAFIDECFSDHIQTDGLSIDDIVQRIEASI
jgi:hypothetical protein